MLVWDATCPDTLAPSYSRMAVREPGAVAADAEYKKIQKYMHFTSSHFFVPVAVETLGVFRDRGASLFQRGCSEIADDHFIHQHLVQRISVEIQRGNAEAVLGSMGVMAEG